MRYSELEAALALLLPHHTLERTGTGMYRISIRQPHGVEWPTGKQFVGPEEVLRRAARIAEISSAC